MKRFEKITILIICLGFVFGLVLCLSACKKEPVSDDSTKNEHRNEYDGLSFGYINAKDCEDGNITEDKMKADIQFEMDNTYYMVIDFDIQAERDNSGTDRLHTKLEILPASAIAATIQDAPTGEAKQEIIADKTNISLSFKIPELAETVKSVRILIQLKPQHSSDTRIKLSFEGENNLNAVKTTSADDLILGDYTQGLEYTETEDCGYAVSQGTAIGEEQIVIPTYKDDRYVTSINENAFSYCSSLKSIAIPDSVTSIGYSAFSECSSLNYNEYNNGLYLGNDNNPYHFFVKVKDKAITSFVINANTKVINSYAFGNCSTLASLIIPDGVTSIGTWAFSGCDSLTSITIPNSVTAIGDSAFSSCISLIYNKFNNVSYLGNDSNPYLILVRVNDNSISSFEINNEVKLIYDGAFSGCNSLTSITIPDSVTSIGRGAFENCGPLNVYINSVANWCSIKLSDENSNPLCYAKNIYLNNQLLTNLVIPDGVTSIGKQAFYCCDSLTSITIPGSVTYIGDNAFSGCHSLSSVTIPDSVTYIGNNSFSGCSSLLSITIGNSVTSIGDYAFSECSYLTSIAIPDSVTSIGGGAFKECTSLKNVTLPHSVRSIKDSAFEGCSCLTSIILPNSVTYIGEKAFSGCDSLSSIALPDSVTYISGHAFSDCDSLSSITIPKSVTSIGPFAFYWCDSLTSITIPGSVTYIGDNAFSGCRSLSSITIPDSVTYVGSSAFEGCSSLTCVTIPDSVTSINDSAFEGCGSLSSIRIPHSVTSIGYAIFRGCSSLTSINFDGTKYEWNAIKKDDNWNYDGIEALNYNSTIKVVIHCKDGDVRVG